MYKSKKYKLKKKNNPPLIEWKKNVLCNSKDFPFLMCILPAVSKSLPNILSLNNLSPIIIC